MAVRPEHSIHARFSGLIRFLGHQPDQSRETRVYGVLGPNRHEYSRSSCRRQMKLRAGVKIARALLLLWIAGLEAPHDGPGRSGGPFTLLFTRQVGFFLRVCFSAMRATFL